MLDRTILYYLGHKVDIELGDHCINPDFLDCRIEVVDEIGFVVSNHDGEKSLVPYSSIKYMTIRS